MLTNRPPYTTGLLRFDFQIASVRRTEGLVLNVGSKEDPARLKERFGGRVMNVDLEDHDHDTGEPIHPDMQFDCLDTPWPFESDSIGLVVFGDLLEHFPVEQSIVALREAARVTDALCVTVPEEHVDETGRRAAWEAGVCNPHTTVMTRQVLLDLLDVSDWEPDWLVSGAWGIRDENEQDWNGWCVFARRRYERDPAAGVELPELVAA